MKKINSLILFTLLLLINSSSLFADEITIEDTSGVIRSVSEVDAAATVKFTVTDPEGRPLDGAVINLTSKENSEKRQGIAVDGTVEFLNVAPGRWMVSTESFTMVFSDVNISEFQYAVASMGDGSAVGVGDTAAVGGTTAGVSTTAIVAGGVIAAGGITAIAVTASDSDSDDEPLMSPFE